MELKQLIFGVGLILREQVTGWATHQDDQGNTVPHVYPDHPPLDLSKSSYPRATVDTIGHSQVDSDIEKNAFIGDMLLDVTVYAVNSGTAHSLLGDSIQAVIDYHDKDNDSGNPYLPDWSFEEIGISSPIIDEQTSKQFTRYAKTQELEFQHVTATTLAT